MNHFVNSIDYLIVFRVMAGLLIGLSLTTINSGALQAQETSTAEQSKIERLRQKVEDNPARSDWRYELARELERNNQYTKARGHYRQLVTDHPENPDYRFGLSRVLFYQDNLRGALREIQKARSDAPDYPGVYRHELNVLVTMGKRKKARTLARDAQNRFPDESFNIPQQDLNWKINWSSSVDSLSGTREDWQSHGFKLTRIKDEFDLTVGAERVTRFGEYGDRTSFRVVAKSGEYIQPFLAYQTSSSVKFLADDHLRGGVRYLIQDGVELRIAGEKRDYDDTGTIGVQPGVTFYHPQGYFGYTWYHSELELNTDRDANTHFFFGQYNVKDDLSIGGGVSVGEAIESTGSNQVQRSDLVSYSISITRELSRKNTIELRYEYEDLEQFYIRRGLTLSLSHDF